MLSKISGNLRTYKLEEFEYPMWFGNVFNFEKDTAPHKIVMAVAPTGSGKTLAISNFAQYLADTRSNKRILLIENRRGRVDQTISQSFIELDDEKKIQSFVNNLSFGGNLSNDGLRAMVSAGLSDMLPEEIKMFQRESEKVGTIYNKHACVTSAKLEFFLEAIYFKLGEKSYEDDLYKILWDIFDYIIIDEIHSIITDATYQNAPFHSYELIRAFNKYCDDSGKHMILLTATMEPLKTILSNVKDLQIYDFSEVCVAMKPKNISFIEYNDVKKDIEANYLADPNWHCVYFITWPIPTVEEFCKDTAINPDDVIVIFSDNDSRKGISEKDYRRMKKAEADISAISKTEEDFRITIVSSKYKEGVDFKWFINTMYISSHTMDDVIQMSGRARFGNHNLKVVVGSNEFYGYEDFKREEDLFEAEKGELKRLNKLYESLSPIEKKRLIKFVTIEDYDRLEEDEPYHPYIRFNYFENHFQMYRNKYECFKYLKKAFTEWHKKNSKQKPNHYQKILQKWFENIPVEPYYSKEFLAKEYVHKYAKYTNRPFSKEKKDKIETALCEIWGKNHSLNWFLDALNLPYKCERNEHNKKEYVFVNMNKK